MSDPLIHLSSTNKNSMSHLLSGKHRFLLKAPFIFQFSILTFRFSNLLSSSSPHRNEASSVAKNTLHSSTNGNSPTNKPTSSTKQASDSSAKSAQ